MSATASPLPRQKMSGQSDAGPKKLSLADSVRGSRKLPSRVVFHAMGGVGKTCFAAHAPSPYFILSPGETGLHTLMDSGILPEIPNIEIPTWPSLFEILDDLRSSEHNFKTVVIDVADGMEKLCRGYICRTQYNGDLGEKGFGGYSRGDRYIAAGPWQELLAALDRLRSERGVMPMLLSHTIKATYQNPTGPDYDRFVGNIYKDSWQLTYDWADIVLFGNFVTSASKDKGDKRGKGSGGSVRTIATEYDATADAKNRHGLTGDISMGGNGKEAWHNFISAIKDAKQSASAS